MTEAKLTEAQIKALVLGHLRRTGVIDRNTVIANEFRLGHTSVRSDLAMLAKSFIGVEIKSDLDSLRRLPNQVAAYSRHFERFIVVVTPRHARSLDFSTTAQAEIWVVQQDGNLEPITERDAKNSINYKGLMTLEETRRFFNVPNAKNAGSVSERDGFAVSFKARYGKTSETFWERVRGKRITEESLRHLSRFKDVREKQQLAKQLRTERNMQWSSIASLLLKVA